MTIRTLAVLAAAAVLSGCAALREPEEQAYIAASAVDMGQTWDLDHSTCVAEGNPLLGAHPSHAKTAAYFVATDAMHAGISEWLLDHDHRKLFHVWEFVSIGLEGFSIGVNFGHGVKPFHGTARVGCR